MGNVTGTGNATAMKISPAALLLHQGISGSVEFIVDLCSITHQTSVAISAGLAQAFALSHCIDSDPDEFNPGEFVQSVLHGSRIGKRYFPETLNEEDITDRLALCENYADGPQNDALPRWKMAAAMFITACRLPTCSSCGVPSRWMVSTKS